MGIYNLSLTFDTAKVIIRMILDIGIMWMLLYYAIKLVKNNARTIQIFKGIILILLVNAVATLLGLTTVSWLAGMFVNWGFLAVIIVFQPEIRSLLEKIGTTSVFSRLSSLSGNAKEQLVDAVVTASMLLSRNQTGALITIEQTQSLSDYVNTGTKINSVVSAELLTSLFVTSTPLHDGAVIIQGDRIACASAYFPLTNAPVPSRYGTRHRAALGISELSDAVTIIVSEETGSISVADGGQITQVNRKELREYLTRVICGQGTEVLVTEPKKKIVAPVVVEREELKNNGEDEYVIEPAKEEQGAKSETSVLGRLAIKRYSDEKEFEYEEEGTSEIVSSPEVVKTAEESQKEKKRFGLFKKKEKKSEKKTTSGSTAQIKKLEQEENDIKLPRKKENMTPISFELEKTTSIPTQNYYLPEERRVEKVPRSVQNRQDNAGYINQYASAERNTEPLVRRTRSDQSNRNTHEQTMHPVREMERKSGVKIRMDVSDDEFATKSHSFQSQLRQAGGVVEDAVEIEAPQYLRRGGSSNGKK
ncbi:MAG: diadenylate cyclase CdaA [Anaerorhabdus sp.]